MTAVEFNNLDPVLLGWAQSIRAGDPLLFATNVLGFQLPVSTGQDKTMSQGHDDLVLEPWQVKALKKFGKQWRARFVKPGRLSIRSGHGVGKTAFLCIILLFVLFAGGTDTKIPVVANTLDQLRDGMWPEINKWIQKLPEELREQVTWQKEKVFLTCAPEECFAVCRTASKHRPEALQGIHAKTVLVVFEEASGIPEETYVAGLGSLSTPGAMAVAVGNPTRASGFFHKSHNDPHMRAEWETMVVSSEDVTRAIGHIQTIINLYGKDSNKYRVRVLGEFPTKDDDTVIPLEWCEAAKKRVVERSPCWPVWGADIARFGDDRITLLKRQGNSMLAAPMVWRHLDGGQVAGRIIAEYRKTPVDMRPKAICVDVLNVGASVVDFLNRSPELTNDDVMIVAVNVAEVEGIDPLNHRLRDELWWKAREWFQAKDCSIRIEHMNQDETALVEELIGELTTPTYDLTAAGKRIVISKSEMKKELGHSPDIADGFILTFAAPVFQRDVPRHRDWDAWDRSQSYRDPWAA